MKKLLLLLFVVFFCLKSAPLYAFDKVLELSGRNHKVTLYRDTKKQEVKIRFKKKGFLKSSQWGGPFSIASQSDVDATLIKAEHFLNSFSVPESDRQEVLSRLMEYRYISQLECNALHFAPVLSQETEKGSVKSLLGQVRKIANFTSDSGRSPDRSLVIGEFEVAKDDIVQVRMVLDEDGEFMSFSFARADGRELGYSWETKDQMVLVKDSEGKTLLALDLSLYTEEGGLVEVKTTRENDLETEERSYIRLTKVSTGKKEYESPWEVSRYTTQHFEETKIQGGVPLTTAIAEHTPVIRLHDSDVVFQQLDYDRVHAEYIVDNDSSDNESSVRHFYNICMAERTSLSYEQVLFGFDDLDVLEADSMKFCERVALAKSYREDFLSQLDSSDLKDKYGDLLDEYFRNCLVKEKISESNEGLYSLSFKGIVEKESSEFSSSLNSCLEETQNIYAQKSLEALQSELALSASNEYQFAKITPENFALSRSFLTKCLKIEASDKKEGCTEKAKSLSEVELMMSFLDGRLEDLNISSQSSGSTFLASCLVHPERMENEEVYTKMKSCLQSYVSEAISKYPIDFYRSEIIAAGLSDSDADFGQMRSDFDACMVEQLSGDEEQASSVTRWSLYESRCMPKALQSVLRTKLSSEAQQILSQFTGWEGLSDEEKKNFKELIELEVNKSVSYFESSDDLSQLSDDFIRNIYGEIVSLHFDRLSESNDSDFAKVIGASLGVNGRVNGRRIERTFKESLLSLKSSQTARQSYKIKTADILKLMYAKGSSASSSEEVSSVKGSFSELNEEELESVSEQASEELSSCYDQIDVSSQQGDFPSEMKSCQMENYAQMMLSLGRKDLEKKVSAHFLVDDDATNSILLTVNKLKKCLNRFTTEQYFENYKNKMMGCQKMALFDTEYGILKEKYSSYGPLLEKEGASWNSSTGPFCFSSALRKNVMAVEGNKVDGLIKAGDLTETFKNNDYSVLNALLDDDHSEMIDIFSQTEESALKEQLSACHDQIDNLLANSFSSYILGNIPSLSGLSSDDKNRETLVNFFDYELVSLLLKFQKVNDVKGTGSAIDLGALVSDERIVTAELGVSSLENFIGVLADLFNRGFVYDEAGMRTELVVFRSELKDFLKWYNTNPNDVTIREAKEFFSESELGEHLAMAVISESTYTKFTRGINAMRQDEIKKFFEDTYCGSYENCFGKKKRRRGYPYVLKRKYEAVIKKYDDLLSLSKEMTSSYDFRRIIRPESTDGRALMEKATSAVIGSRIIGETVSAQAEEDLMKDIGEAILKDNTDGGFAERFVEVVADFDLKKDEDSHWAITKWLFYDDGDFDWDTLRQTESGQQALNYYSRFIMLPKMLGESQSRYLVNLRKEKFQELLRKAQDENNN